MSVKKKMEEADIVEFQEKEVKRAIRDLEEVISSLNRAGIQVYVTRLRSLIRLVEENSVLNEVVYPYLTLEIDRNQIEKGSDWITLNLPEEEDLEIAYVLQTVKIIVDGDLDIQGYTVRIFKHREHLRNINSWNEQILMPALQSLLNKLNDMIEDEVEGKEGINSESLQVINYGEIHATGSNIAFGSSNTQSIVTESHSQEIIDKALDSGMIDESEKEIVKELTEKIDQELKETEPSKNHLKEIAGKFVDLGSKALLTITTEAIKNPLWSQAVIEFFSEKF